MPTNPESCNTHAKVDILSNDIVIVLNTTTILHVPQHRKNFYKV